MEFVKCLIYVAGIGVLSFLIGRVAPVSWFPENRFPYRCYRWEQEGRFYQRFGIRKWQAKVPDMSKILPGAMQAKKVTGNFSQELPRMITETCIAEWIHVLLCFAVLPCLWIWPGWGGILFTALYILGNLPFILIQRYNRPRLVNIRNKMFQTRKDVSICQH